MKYEVQFRVQQHQCCPAKFYWVGKTVEVEADSVEQAEQRICELTAAQVVEIKSIKEKNNV